MSLPERSSNAKSAACRLAPTYELIDLIGQPYVYGEWDCIHVVLEALDRMGIEAPPMDQDWYEMPVKQWARDLLKWGDRINEPRYVGDVIVWANPPGFAVVWNQGYLHINEHLQKVHWFPLSHIRSHFSRTNATSLRSSAFRKKNIETLPPK